LCLASINFCRSFRSSHTSWGLNPSHLIAAQGQADDTEDLFWGHAFESTMGPCFSIWQLRVDGMGYGHWNDNK
jgi:hypothetical protein